MKNKNLLFLSFAAVFALASCKNEPKTKATSEPETCSYSYNAGTSKVSWTAYKFIEKTGVKGGFDSVYVDGVAGKGTLSELFEKASFRIPVSTLNTLNPDRDAKIKKFFFGSLKNGLELSGKVTSIKGDDQTGTMTCSLSMNGQEQSANMSYFMSGDTLIVKGDIDVNKWGAGEGITKLNKECAVLHVSPSGDKTSKLWPEVSLEIRTILSKTCE